MIHPNSAHAHDDDDTIFNLSFTNRVCIYYFILLFSEQKFYHCKWTLNVIKINRKIALHPTLCILFYIYIRMCIYLLECRVNVEHQKKIVSVWWGVREDIINVIIERKGGEKKIFLFLFSDSKYFPLNPFWFDQNAWNKKDYTHFTESH